MSPEDIFASQMWPWPDPALKRDTMGRVLFMNAAFLQLYGGNIEDWRGNVISGWPAPQPPGMPYRFETRMPSDLGEQVYDWIEYTLADGSAMALARNVTHFSVPSDPPPGFAAEPPVQVQAEQAPVQQAPVEATPQEVAAPEPAAQPNYAEMAPAAAGVAAAGLVAAPAIAAAVQPSIVPEDISEALPVLDVPEISVPDIDVPDLNLDAAPEEPVMAVEAAPVAAEPVVEERAYERRALPLEDENAVLGNNWRDAVIAKAVGAEVETPIEEPEEQSPAAAVKDGTETEEIRILLAEDNAINALLTRTLLEADGHVVETVEDGVLAVEAMKSSHYDLIFMDMRMPNMDGLEATRKIRAMDHVSKGLPIIALTANAFDDDRNACFDSGMNDFMTKPVSAEELSEMVRTWTKNKAQRDAA